MGLIEIRSPQRELTPRQRWGNYFALIYAAIAIVIGINLRESTLSASLFYEETQAGIRAFYPQNWLLDTEGGYVFRVRDMAQSGFKTTIQVEVRPVALNISARNLLDDLTLSRAQTFSSYNVLESRDYPLQDIQATAMSYVYVAADDNPFLQTLPTVVEGLDIIVNEGGQAVIITFLSDAQTYEQNLPTFERFLDDLQF